MVNASHVLMSGHRLILSWTLSHRAAFMADWASHFEVILVKLGFVFPLASLPPLFVSVTGTRMTIMGAMVNESCQEEFSFCPNICHVFWFVSLVVFLKLQGNTWKIVYCCKDFSANFRWPLNMFCIVSLHKNLTLDHNIVSVLILLKQNRKTLPMHDIILTSKIAKQINAPCNQSIIPSFSWNTEVKKTQLNLHRFLFQNTL